MTSGCLLISTSWNAPRASAWGLMMKAIPAALAPATEPSRFGGAAMRRANDIKAPDGFLLGGLRLVRRDGTILFQRGYWQAPLEWAGEKVWVHEEWVNEPGHSGRDHLVLEAAAPGRHIYEARTMSPPHTVLCERTDRPDAKPGYRIPAHKAWATRTGSAEQ
jgi:hypothetical protein